MQADGVGARCAHPYRKFLEFTVPTNDADHILDRRMVQYAEAERRIKEIVKDRGVIVQAGGNWGYWPHKLAELFATVYTFEPDHVCFSCLVANTAHQPNVVRFQAALGDNRALVDLKRKEGTTGNQHVDGRPGIYPTLRIDDLGLTRCDMIYLDVEGQEAKAIWSARGTIELCHPVVAFESKARFGVPDSGEAEGLLRLYGYRRVGAIGNDAVMVFDA